MRTLRHYFVTDSLDEVAQVEHELKEQDITSSQFHVLSRDDAGMAERQLNSVYSLMRRDIINSGLIGAGTGLTLAALVLGGAWALGLTTTAAGWTPFIFLAIVAFGFCTWEGGLYGIQEPNRAFEAFTTDLDKGHHVVFVDAAPAEKGALLTVMQNHKRLKFRALAIGRPAWILRLMDNLRDGVDRNLASEQQFQR
ncbi:MAG: magnesium transporter [Pseudomonadales bacterium]